MSIRKPLIGFGLFAAFSAIIVWILGATLNHIVPGSTNTYTATFANILGLKPGSDVRMAGVRVGRVDDIKINNDNNAVVTFTVQDDQPVYQNTKATIKFQNLIGQRFLGLAPGKGEAPRLADGGAIPMYIPGTKERQTVDTYDISMLLGGFEPLLNSLQPDQINNLTSTLIMSLQGDKISLTSFIAQASQLADTVGQRDQVLGSILTNMSELLKGVANKNAELQEIIAQSRALVGGLVEQGEALKGSTEQIAAASNSLVGIVSDIRPNLALAQHYSNDAMAVLIGAGPILDTMAVDGTYELRDLARTFDNGNYLNAYICSLDVSLWGVLLPRQIISMIGGNSRSEVCR